MKRCAHNKTHGLSHSKIYRLWHAMKRRCIDPKVKSYKDYGARGITISDSWLKFENFFADMGYKPKGMSLGRIDNDGPYSKENCRWETSSQQAINKRKYRNNSSGFIGIEIQKTYFRARIRINGKSKYLGCYETLEEAIKARKEGVDYFRYGIGTNKWENRKKIQRNNKSGTPGVIFQDNRWIARININKKRIHLGMFSTKDDAINARKKAETQWLLNGGDATATLQSGIQVL